MNKLDPNRVYTQYRDIAKPYEPVVGRKYTITHSDTTGELFVVISEDYAEDKVTEMRDEVRIMWDKNEKGFLLVGTVLIDGEGVTENAPIRNQIFYREMPIALQALRQADRFLFGKHPNLDNTHVVIKFISNNPMYNKAYDFGVIGKYA